MPDYKIETVGAGAEIVAVPADRFKTNELSISFFMPLSDETASVNAAVPMLLSRNSMQYPTILSLNRKLASLYGAVIEASVSKVGEIQQLKLGMTCLDDRFSLDGEKITAQCIKLLLSMAFNPLLDENGCFPADRTEREKQVLIEKIESDENEKRLYVLKKAEELMFAGEPYAVGKYGTRQQIAAITPQSATAAWKNILKSAKIVLTVVGNADVESAKADFAEYIDKIERNYIPLDYAKIAFDVPQVNRAEEALDIKQGKLVIGFRADCSPKNTEAAAQMRAFCDVFGGGPYSKLFANVREKMSLCYYCSARFVKQKSFIMVQSGCEEPNMEKAEKEILAQIEEIKKGNFDYEFNSSKAGLSDALRSVCDAPESLEVWYTAQAPFGEYISPLESAALNDGVTKQQIIDCANKIKLDTVYKLVCTNSSEEGAE